MADYCLPAGSSGDRSTGGRALRGGSWNNNQNNARVASRNDNNNPNNRNNNIGFRVVAHALRPPPAVRRVVIDAAPRWGIC